MKKDKSFLVSVIMNCYNGEKYLKKSVKSLLSQKYKNWELIFWDNQSTDNSKKILLSFKDNRLKYFHSNIFSNLYKARNQAIKKAKGKFICFLDTDDWWSKNKLSRQVELINSNKEVNFIYTNFYVYDQKTKKKKIVFAKKMKEGKITQTLLDRYNVGILTVMINKKFFKKKGFKEKYKIMGDFDFFINLSLKENFYSIQDPLAYYRVHNDNFSKKIDIFYSECKSWISENEKKFLKFNYSIFYIKMNFFKLWIKIILKHVFS